MSSTFLAQWPDKSITVISGRSKQAVMMELDEVADPYAANVKLLAKPLSFDLKPDYPIKQKTVSKGFVVVRKDNLGQK